MLRAAALAAGARILHGHFHTFGAGGGVTGVLLLAESHISIHTWPEERFAAVDIFMCGAARPELALAAIRTAFGEAGGDMHTDVRTVARGS
jgi:S-adenosylmethionine decarboxylase